jgi:hypothetical protein
MRKPLAALWIWIRALLEREEKHKRRALELLKHRI